MPGPGEVKNHGTATENSVAATGLRTRGEPTRQRILDAALSLFRERGYDETTMRAIAGRASVPVGNAYYYFAGKQALLDTLAEQLHNEYLDACRPVLERERELEARLGGVLAVYWETVARYEPVASEILMLATDPRSPLNLFGPHPSRRRKEEIDLFAEVVRGSRTTIHNEIAGILPTLLWLYHLGLQHLWLHDATPNRERTRRRTNESIAVVVRLIELLLRPPFKPVRSALVQLCAAVGITDAGARTSSREIEDRAGMG